MKQITTILLITMVSVSCKKEPTIHNYCYNVTGFSYSRKSFLIIYKPDKFVTISYNGVRNWSYNWMQQDIRHLSISAENNNNTGWVTVTITKDGNIIATKTSTEPFGKAAISGNY